MKKRHLIPDDQIIVVLDTSPIRNLAYSAQPEWVKTFEKMAADGYSFSLADCTVGELLTQVRSGAIPQDGYDRMIESIKIFLNPDFPMLPGKLDLEAMIGVLNEPHRFEEIKYLSQVGWSQLLAPHAPSNAMGPPLGELLEEERTDWKKILDRMAVSSLSQGIDLSASDPDDVAEFLANSIGTSLDRESDITPSMAIRMHLELRYIFRQMARSKKKKSAYDPENKKNRNDGIDLDIYKYFILPALVVAEDSGFFESLQTIQSFQREWFYKPGELAARWNAGERPGPEWPVDEE